MLLGSMAGVATAADPSEQTLVPIGGGYTTTSLEGFAEIVVDHATGDTVDILVEPSSYGNDPADLDENTELALDRTDQIEDACNAVVDTAEFPGGCVATLLHLFMRSQTEGPEGEAAIDLLMDSETDGVYILGGDQTIAMEVLANSDVEDAMETAYLAGVVYGGTSAGAAVQSTTMIGGYTDPGWPYNAMEKDKVIVWWSNDQTGPDDFTRGLSFSSDTAITDQHFYQRGRFARLLNVVMQSDEQFAGQSKVGIGVDYATGVQITDDQFVHGVFGDSSVAIIDAEALNATHQWVGPNMTLSARNMLTHIIGADPDITYDTVNRTISDASGVQTINAWAIQEPELDQMRMRATLMLGGDLSDSWDGPAMAEFIRRTEAARMAKMMVVAVGATYADGQALAREYVAGLREAGLPWWYQVQTFVYDQSTLRYVNSISFNRTAGVVFVGDDQASMTTAMSNHLYGRLVERALDSVPVVLTDQAVTAVMGERYVTNPDPTDDDVQDVAIASFQAGNIQIANGLGIVPGSLQGTLTYDQHWGRLYSLAMDSPDTMVYGISEMTALVVNRSGATVVGDRSVVTLDGSQGTYSVGTNGAFSALNVVLNAYGPGDAVE